MTDLFCKHEVRALPRFGEIAIFEDSGVVYMLWPAKGERGRHFEVITLNAAQETHATFTVSRSEALRLSAGECKDWRVQTMSSFNKHTRLCLTIIEAFGESHFISKYGASRSASEAA